MGLLEGCWWLGYGLSCGTWRTSILRLFVLKTRWMWLSFTDGTFMPVQVQMGTILSFGLHVGTFPERPLGTWNLYYLDFIPMSMSDLFTPGRHPMKFSTKDVSYISRTKFRLWRDNQHASLWKKNIKFVSHQDTRYHEQQEIFLFPHMSVLPHLWTSVIPVIQIGSPQSKWVDRKVDKFLCLSYVRGSVEIIFHVSWPLRQVFKHTQDV